MSRWTQYDEDSYRLPEGMKRVGYDADTGRYLFRDTDGSLWQGPEGAMYGEMTRVSGSPVIPEEDRSDVEAAHARADGYMPVASDPNQEESMAHKQNVNAAAYRTLFPFFLIIGVVLLLVWRYVISPGVFSSAPMCPKGERCYIVEPGDSCWDIAHVHGLSFERFMELNPKVDCAMLRPGMAVCLPAHHSHPAPTPSG